jgi:hypothetical protein
MYRVHLTKSATSRYEKIIPRDHIPLHILSLFDSHCTPSGFWTENFLRVMRMAFNAELLCRSFAKPCGAETWRRKFSQINQASCHESGPMWTWQMGVWSRYLRNQPLSCPSTQPKPWIWIWDSMGIWLSAKRMGTSASSLKIPLILHIDANAGFEIHN